MKRDYEFGFIDGNIILRRNLSMFKSLIEEGKVGAEYLMGSILCSILKIARESLNCERYFILWDKKPYYKTLILQEGVGKSEYKTNRPTESDKVAECMGKAKYLILCNAGKFGLTSVQYKGWEADDMAYLASCQVIGRPKKSVLISYDSDWESWMGPNTDYYNLWHDYVKTFDQMKISRPPINGYSVFQSKAIRDAMRGSHNNLKKTLKSEYSSVSTLEVLGAIEKGDYHHFKDYQLFQTQLRTFDFTEYPEYDVVSKFLTSAYKQGSVADLDEFRKLRDQLKISRKQMSSKNYEAYRDKLNLKHWDKGRSL